MRRFYKILLVLVVLNLSAPVAAELRYRLTEGSTVTNLLSGEVEVLGGNFVWREFLVRDDLALFTQASLEFQGESVSLLNDTSQATPVGSAVWLEDDPERCLISVCATSFSAQVTVSGIDNDAPEIVLSGFGSYEGLYTAPTSISYENLLLSGSEGQRYARVNLNAVLIPLPTAFFSFLCGLAFLAGVRSRRKRL